MTLAAVLDDLSVALRDLENAAGIADDARFVAADRQFTKLLDRLNADHVDTSSARKILDSVRTLEAELEKVFADFEREHGELNKRGARARGAPVPFAPQKYETVDDARLMALYREFMKKANDMKRKMAPELESLRAFVKELDDLYPKKNFFGLRRRRL